MKFVFRPLFTLGHTVITPITLLWFVLTLAAALAEAFRGDSSINNYLIFKGVFTHTVQQQHLYAEYATEYFDSNHYGPVFAVLIAPFALLPNTIGVVLWCLVNAFFLFWAIGKLNLEERKKQIAYAIVLIELMTSVHNVQFNPMLAAFLILAFVYTEKGKDIFATLFIAAGFLIKLYGIAGLLFFVFSRNKKNFVLSFIGWCLVLFVLPMLLSSPSFVIQSYQDWFHSLQEKHIKNLSFDASGGMQDISVSGMISRIGKTEISPLVVLIPAALCILSPLLRFKQYNAELFRYFYLSIVLLSVVIFSSSAESATYVIAVSGAALWYICSPFERTRTKNIVLIVLFLLTILSPTDLIPYYIKVHFIRAYSLKALPCFLVWCILIYDVFTRNFQQKTLNTL